MSNCATRLAGVLRAPIASSVRAIGPGNLGAGLEPFCEAQKAAAQLDCCGRCPPGKSLLHGLPSNAKLFHQFIIGSGCGLPPGSCFYDENVTCGDCSSPSLSPNTDPVRDVDVLATTKCHPLRPDGTNPFKEPKLLYENWIDVCSFTWYVLQRSSTTNQPIGYRVQGLSGTAHYLDTELDIKWLGDPNTVTGSNLQQTFVIGNPPTPTNISSLLPASGTTLTPNYVLTLSPFGYQVFERDQRTNRYFRDSYNSRCTEPQFPLHPCNGELFVQRFTNGAVLFYQYDGETGHWYLADTQQTLLDPATDVPELVALLSAGLDPRPTNDLEPLRRVWSRCNKPKQLNPACTGIEPSPSVPACCLLD